MVTLYNMGVRLAFIRHGSEMPVTYAAESRKELIAQDTKQLSFGEFETITLKFTSSDPDDRLYFEGIDLLPEGMCHSDENGDLYLSPSIPDSYPIQVTEHYSMRVGVYEFRIVHRGKTYYQWYEISPENLNDTEWAVMQKDLEDEVRGLSIDMLKKNLSFSESEDSDRNDLYRFFVIKDMAAEVLAALLDLRTRPNFRLEKKYQMEMLTEASRVDNVTLKSCCRRAQMDRGLVPHPYYNYDLPENRWLKRIVLEQDSILARFISTAESNVRYLRREIAELKRFHRSETVIRIKEKALSEIARYMVTARRIMHISDLLKEEEWYQEVGEFTGYESINVMHYDSRYHILMELHNRLQQNDIDIYWNPDFSYAFKLSSRMYEVWAFIKVCRFLTSPALGFTAEGWLFGKEFSDRLLIPDLTSGTSVIFKRDDITIKAYYDKMIPGSVERTEEADSPVFSRQKYKKPDIRLDFYRGDVYYSSLILEVKYRRMYDFWSSASTSCRDQVSSYKNDISSQFCMGYDKKFVLNKIRPVDYVWVLNPTKGQDTIISANEGIKLVQMLPGHDHSEIVEALKQEIDEVFAEDEQELRFSFGA